MDNFVDERDYKLLEKDKYTFFILSLVMGGQCEKLLTDHERLIVCYTCKPYPVWIWTPDDASQDELERAYQLAIENGWLDGEHRFILKYDVARYFIERANADDKHLSIRTNMYAYNCPDLIKPSVIADGALHRCDVNNVDELVDILDSFHSELQMDQASRDEYRLQAEADIADGNVFFWKDKQENNVACCKYTTKDNLADIRLVYTRPQFRRKHYAENLVYQVTKIIKEAGYDPMLYTDADYAASNACYVKIGYVLKGKLCTIG